jgi:hypothetical protein
LLQLPPWTPFAFLKKTTKSRAGSCSHSPRVFHSEAIVSEKRITFKLHKKSVTAKMLRNFKVWICQNEINI